MFLAMYRDTMAILTNQVILVRLTDFRILIGAKSGTLGKTGRRILLLTFHRPGIVPVLTPKENNLL